MPMARTDGARQRPQGRSLRAPAGRASTTSRTICWRTTACPARCAIRSRARSSGRARASSAASSIAGRAVRRRAPIFGPFEIDEGPDDRHALVDGIPADRRRCTSGSRSCARRATRSSPRRSGPHGQVIGELPEQVMYPGVAAQRISRRSSRAASRATCRSSTRTCRSRRCSASRARACAARVRRRQLLHAADAESLSCRPRRRGAAAELDASRARTDSAICRRQTATMSVERADVAGGRLDFDVAVQNLTGHKLPTGYPSRRAWLHVTVRDRTARRVRVGRDHADRLDRRATTTTRTRRVRAALHRDPRARPGADLRVDHGRSSGRADDRTADGRAVPEGQPAAAARGFDKTTAETCVQVVGEARARMPTSPAAATSFGVLVDLGAARGPIDIEVELRFQPIAYRWAHNLDAYDAAETNNSWATTTP